MARNLAVLGPKIANAVDKDDHMMLSMILKNRGVTLLYDHILDNALDNILTGKNLRTLVLHRIDFPYHLGKYIDKNPRRGYEIYNIVKHNEEFRKVFLSVMKGRPYKGFPLRSTIFICRLVGHPDWREIIRAFVAWNIPVEEIFIQRYIEKHRYSSVDGDGYR